MAASQISPHNEGAEEPLSMAGLTEYMQQGQLSLLMQRLGVFLLLLLSEVWGTEEGLPDFNEREVRPIANIPEKFTPYVKELGIR